MWLQLADIKARDAAGRLQHGELEFESNPFAPIFFRHFDRGRMATGLNYKLAGWFVDAETYLRISIGWRGLPGVARAEHTSGQIHA